MFNNSEDRNTSHQPSKTSPSFETNKDAQQYLSSIASPRDIVCPITQELFKYPVVASDGHTYEKSAINTWFESQRNSTGSIRSPVTNAYIDASASGMMLIENKAVAGMARSHREYLGNELCLHCQAVLDDVPECLGDNGFRIKGLVEAGADLSIKGCAGGNTAFMAILQSDTTSQMEQIKFELLNYFIAHNVSVSVTNDDGKNCITLTEELISKSDNSNNNHASSTTLAASYKQLLPQIIQRSKVQEEQSKAKFEAMNELNSEHRERQRFLAQNARDNDGSTDSLALGRMDVGWGYFPCLPALLFQGNIPAPPASFAEEEAKEKKRLQFILRVVYTLLLMSLFLC